MTAPNSPLARHLVPPLTEARLARQYAVIAERCGREGAFFGARLKFVSVASAIVAVGALAFVVTRVHPPPTPSVVAEGTVLESTGRVDGPPLALVDGSRVALGKASRARLTVARRDAIFIELERGQVDVEATHVAGRTFRVAAHGYEVAVVGTHFSVEASSNTTRVSVTEGRVQVRAPDGSSRPVSAGEAWSGAWTADAPVDDGTRAGSGDASAPVIPESLTEPTPASTRTQPISSARTTAKSMLDDAERALGAGLMSEAAQKFDRVRKQYPRDPRAGLAAFELGRIRLDSEGDAKGAEEAFRDAMRLRSSATVREDAEARRIEAIDRLATAGRSTMSACAEARDAYLARYPVGVHRRIVSTRCQAR